MKKICFVLTAEFAVKAFMLEHVKKLSSDFDVSVIVNTNNPYLLSELNIKVTVIPLSIARDISLLSDICSLFRLIKIFYLNKYDAVHTITPKAGLLGMLAALFTCVKFRIHTFQGEVWVTKKGIMRSFLKFLDKLVAIIATNIIVVSTSERDFLISHNIINKEKSIVFHQGSIAGVNLQRFSPNLAARKKIRKQLGINDTDIIFIYIGRLNKDKGVLDLVNAFSQTNNQRCHLLIVGPDEHNLTPEIEAILKYKPCKFHLCPETNQPEIFMAASDVLCLPSYREGFGVVIIEAAACGITSIASAIYGVTDAVIDNKTGLLHEKGSVHQIKKMLDMFAENDEMRLRFSKNALLRVEDGFDSSLITQAWYDFYQQLLN